LLASDLRRPPSLSEPGTYYNSLLAVTREALACGNYSYESGHELANLFSNPVQLHGRMRNGAVSGFWPHRGLHQIPCGCGRGSSLLDNGDGDRAAREKLSSMRSVRILVADDHVVVRRGLRALLQAQPPWKVVAEASTGVEAVEKAARLQPDLVIMDLSMPELNGLDATGLILKAAPKTRVLILTMHNAEELIERTLKAGARGYVLKSDAERDLITAIEAVLDNRTFFTPSVSEAVLDCLRQRDRESVNLQGDSLTSRERQIVQLLAEGKSNKEVAGALGISVRTVENHRAKIMRKLQLRSLSDLVRHAIRNKIVEA